MEAGILDSFASKFWGITFAANAAVTVLRVDQVRQIQAIVHR